MNERWPSYSVWAIFVKFFELYDVFGRDEDLSLMPSHPGIAKIHPEHKQRIDEVYKKYTTENPNVKPMMGSSTESSYLGRLVWLKYWIDWALENCECPAFYNT